MKGKKILAAAAAALMAFSPISVMAESTEASTEASTEGEATAVTTVGPENGTKFEMWSFVDVIHTPICTTS